MRQQKIHEAVILANGEEFDASRLAALIQNRILLVLDGAYQFAYQMGLPVDYLMGDFDSIDPGLLKEARDQGVKVIDAPDQNLTDLEKGIQFLDKLKLSVVYICAATGLRLDHTLHNLRLLNRYYDSKRKIYLYTNTEVVFAMHDEDLIYEGHEGDGFAALGAPQCIMTTRGLQYDMKDYTLSYEKHSSVCNRMEQDRVSLSVKGSALIIHSLGAIDGK
ncbi:MAG: thiamine diphosphokinase [Pseudomonadota bacterium]